MVTDLREDQDRVPGGWQMMPLGAVFQRLAIPVKVHPTVRYREIGIRSHGKGVFHKEEVTGASLGDKRVFEVVPGALAMNIVFAWEGAVAVMSEHERGMIASHRFPMFVPSGQVAVDIDFVRRFFQTELGVRLLGDASPGGAGRNRTLNQRFTAEIPIPVPPIGEQRKIATILAAVDEAIDATQAVIDQLQVVRKAIMAELLTCGMPGRHIRFKETEIGQIPEEWCIGPLEKFAVLSSGGTPSRQHPEYWNGDICWVKTGEIDYGVIMDTEEKITDFGLQNSSAKMLPPGTLLMAMYGQGATRGRVAILGIHATVNQACLADRAKIRY